MTANRSTTVVIDAGDVRAGEVSWVADLLAQATDPVHVYIVVGGVGRMRQASRMWRGSRTGRCRTRRWRVPRGCRRSCS
jgi:hypothetical protein